MNYNLYIEQKDEQKKKSTFNILKKLYAFISNERRNLTIAFIAILVNAVLNLLGPYLVGYTIDTYVQTKIYKGILLFSGLLIILYITAFFSNLLQMRLMGSIGQRMLYSLKTALPI